jgi:hypothetical protein
MSALSKIRGLLKQVKVAEAPAPKPSPARTVARPQADAFEV